MNLEKLRELEMIDPTPLPPCRPEVFSKVETEPYREITIEKAEVTQSTSDLVNLGPRNLLKPRDVQVIWEPQAPHR
jgi:hypothetical protein